MRYHKTSLARDVLSGQGQALSQAERRILILCDGRRDVAQLLAMLGPEADASIRLLAEQGYLTAAISRMPSHSNPGNHPRAADEPSRPLGAGLGRLLQRGRDAVAAIRPDQAPAAAAPPAGEADALPPTPGDRQSTSAAPAAPSPPAPAPQPRRSTRRSLAACKMYLLDMLQLQRSVDASAMAVEIQTAQGEAELVASLLDALAWLHAATKPGMFMRIAERLQDTLPEAHLASLQQALQPLQAGNPPTGNVVAISPRSNAAG